MDIKEFINQTLGDVINGINEASLKAKEDDVLVYVNNQPVEFDIAVTTASNTNNKKEAGISKVLVAGASRSNETQNSVVSRIKFSATIKIDNRDKSNLNPVIGGTTRNNRF